MLDPQDEARILAPPRQTDGFDHPRGRIKGAPEDFCVQEIPAYDADGVEGGHVLVTMTKRGLGTAAAVDRVADALSISARDIGVAGLKDRHAHTVQTISVPWSARAAIERFEHPDITLSDPRPHTSKLRRGHLRGNRFVIVVRELDRPVDAALSCVGAAIAHIRAMGGLANAFGPQRFGRQAANLRVGLALLSGRARPGRRGGREFEISAGQSAVFNLVLALRRERGLLRTVLVGDILQKAATGGVFWSDEAAIDQARLDEGHVGITGPMVGNKTLAPPEGSAAAALEAEAMARCGVDAAAMAALGRACPGARRPLQIPLGEVLAEAAPRGDDGEIAVRIAFSLPAGSYATTVLDELFDLREPPAADLAASG